MRANFTRPFLFCVETKNTILREGSREPFCFVTDETRIRREERPIDKIFNERTFIADNFGHFLAWSKFERSQNFPFRWQSHVSGNGRSVNMTHKVCPSYSLQRAAGTNFDFNWKLNKTRIVYIKYNVCEFVTYTTREKNK